MNIELALNATNAAILAQQSAWLAAVLSMIMIVINAATLMLFIWIARKILLMEHHANSMHDDLMKFSRAEGRAEQKKEDEKASVITKPSEELKGV